MTQYKPNAEGIVYIQYLSQCMCVCVITLGGPCRCPQSLPEASSCTQTEEFCSENSVGQSSMHLSLVLLILHLWGNVGVSLSQDACSQLPDVPHAQVPEETKKPEYQEGDVIHFTCDPGYRSHEPSKFVCTRRGWLVVSRGTCYSCSQLPVVPHAHVSEVTRKAAYQLGDVIHFTCEAGYTSDLTIKYVCLMQGWLEVHYGKCYFQATGCEPPPADGDLTITGLPENDDPIVPDHVLVFSCNDSGKYMNGSSVLICGKDGQWNHAFPSCKDRCRVPGVTQGVWITPQHAPSDILNEGQKLQFRCRTDGHVLHGNAEVECLANGQWSDPFPTCGPPSRCGRPPPLANGDTRSLTIYDYNHNDRVEYVCQNYYTMNGGPFKICNNGNWIGNIRCLRPCTVDKEIMSKHNIAFKHSWEEKLYSPHEDFITFTCKRHTQPVGTLSMRQQCIDGVMSLPTCR